MFFSGILRSLLIPQTVLKAFLQQAMAEVLVNNGASKMVRLHHRLNALQIKMINPVIPVFGNCIMLIVQFV